MKYAVANLLWVKLQCTMAIPVSLAEKATLQLLIARGLFAYRLSYSRGPQRIIIRISHYRIRAANNV